MAEDLPKKSKINPKRKNPKKRKSKDHLQLPDLKNPKINLLPRKSSQLKSQPQKDNLLQKNPLNKKNNQQKKKSTPKKFSSSKNKLKKKPPNKKKKSNNSKNNLRSPKTSWVT